MTLYRDPNVDAEIAAIEAELDRACWLKLRPWFLGFVLFWVSVWGLTAHAATVTLSCTAPTQNTDGSAISATLAYKAYWGTTSGNLTSAVDLAGPGCKGPVSVPDPIAGQSVTYHFAVTATANSMESARSNVASKTFTSAVPTPTPPVLLTVGGPVNIAMPNYTNFTWKLGAVAGTIAPKIKCDPTRHIPPDHWRVTGPIIWTNGKKDYVVAKCEAT